MPSFQDSALLVFLALILFGPKKLPELARQLGKLMAEFRRASNEFRMQMEDELRAADQLEQQKKIEAMQAAAPIAPALPETPSLTDGSENTIAATETSPSPRPPNLSLSQPQANSISCRHPPASR
jgi:sec-independent protein translocase protein TatB